MLPDTYELLTAEDASMLETFCSLPGLSALDSETLARHGADVHRLLMDGGGRPVARCSLWWSATPPHGEERLGLIGHYAAHDATAAGVLLEAACQELAGHGCTMAIGPMDGSTWRRYRLLTERGSEPPFFLEPDNPDDWPGHFASAGFRPVAGYFSFLNSDLTSRDPRAASLAVRAKDKGISIRAVRREDLQAELQRLYRLSTRSFARNFLYTPIGEADFIADYSPIEPFLVPAMVLVAERDAEAIGVLFGIPDYLQAQRGDAIDTAVLKTLTVDLEWAGIGLGTLMIDRFHQTLVELGYRRTIYALMHEDNASLHMVSRFGSPIRRYSLFARVIGN